ncbi:hypothetical protein HYH02_015331 [Chlamydomonas schloesseri]|uniref:Uncharacterized protein n=1 Tax=Chlamydomonas schloesseri TaxID=2026947 RepID=A0A835VRP8_9CHLO|nr:hypothetical protein HYH02_015331 [Chlamydomonas schloesseri]|eukprot:KAG2423373.1 hypothetical protein HYH02_015331 [Chlamydomonas schloesseri]
MEDDMDADRERSEEEMTEEDIGRDQERDKERDTERVTAPSDEELRSELKRITGTQPAADSALRELEIAGMGSGERLCKFYKKIPALDARKQLSQSLGITLMQAMELLDWAGATPDTPDAPQTAARRGTKRSSKQNDPLLLAAKMDAQLVQRLKEDLLKEGIRNPDPRHLLYYEDRHGSMLGYLYFADNATGADDEPSGYYWCLACNNGMFPMGPPSSAKSRAPPKRGTGSFADQYNEITPLDPVSCCATAGARGGWCTLSAMANVENALSHVKTRDHQLAVKQETARDDQRGVSSSVALPASVRSICSTLPPQRRITTFGMSEPDAMAEYLRVREWREKQQPEQQRPRQQQPLRRPTPPPRRDGPPQLMGPPRQATPPTGLQRQVTPPTGLQRQVTPVQATPRQPTPPAPAAQAQLTPPALGQMQAPLAAPQLQPPQQQQQQQQQEEVHVFNAAAEWINNPTPGGGKLWDCRHCSTRHAVASCCVCGEFVVYQRDASGIMWFRCSTCHQYNVGFRE